MATRSRAALGVLTACCCLAPGAATPRPVLHVASRLRGGASTYGTLSTARPRYYERPMVVRQQPAEAEPAMSDAEKVQVMQQFSHAVVRKAFLQKVYSTVALQLAATALVVGFIRRSPQVLAMLLQRLGIGLVFLPLLPLFALQAMTESRQAGRPIAYALLALFTVLQSVAISAATLRLPLALLMKAGATTAVATGGLSLYALTTRRDFTASGGMLASGLFGLLALGLMQALFGGSWLLDARIGLATVVFCGYLVYNTQLMMGGKKKRQLRPDEHLLAAVQIYTDVINLFLQVLAALSRDERY